MVPMKDFASRWMNRVAFDYRIDGPKSSLCLIADFHQNTMPRLRSSWDWTSCEAAPD